jgi:hypothetical protein
VIGVRADFCGEISADAELARAVANNQALLGPMRDEDLRRAIAEPARKAGLRLETGLIDLVLRDVTGEPGALPLMSHALRETWERRDGRTLTVAAYHASGGVSEAIARTADAVVKQTPKRDRPGLRNIFLRLTELGDDVEDTRRRVPIEELIEAGGAPESVRGLLERLNRARLVTLDNGTAEVAHEVLIRRWPTLRRWLEEDREGIRLHRRLTHAARLWDASRREAADLYRGTRLDAAVEWAGKTNNSALLTQTPRGGELPARLSRPPDLVHHRRGHRRAGGGDVGRGRNRAHLVSRARAAGSDRKSRQGLQRQSRRRGRIQPGHDRRTRRPDRASRRPQRERRRHRRR